MIGCHAKQKTYYVINNIEKNVLTPLRQRFGLELKLDKINTVKSLSGIQNVNWELVKDGLIIHTDNSADSYPIYVLEVSLKNT